MTLFWQISDLSSITHVTFGDIETYQPWPWPWPWPWCDVIFVFFQKHSFLSLCEFFVQKIPEKMSCDTLVDSLPPHVLIGGNVAKPGPNLFLRMSCFNWLAPMSESKPQTNHYVSQCFSTTTGTRLTNGTWRFYLPGLEIICKIRR